MNRNEAQGNGDGMFLVDQAGLIAIRRAFMAGGRDRALAELRRRYMALTYKPALTVLYRILVMPIDPVKEVGWTKNRDASSVMPRQPYEHPSTIRFAYIGQEGERCRHDL